MAISGECSDEIFGGYPWYYKEHLIDSKNFPWSRSIDTRKNIINTDLVSPDFLENYIETAFNSTSSNVVYNSDDEKENTFIFRYVSKNPDLEEIIFNKTYVDEHLFSLTKYVPYCIENNLRDNFLRVYNGIMTNRFRKEEKFSKYSIIEDLLTFSNIEGVSEADPWFYAFFEKEIKALNRPLKESYLMKKLNDERYGKKIFLKPEKEEKPKKQKVELSLELKELIMNMQRVFGTKVNAIGNDRKGRIYIDYYSQDDLDRIYDVVLRK
mgnify:CR=1 FL=1